MSEETSQEIYTNGHCRVVIEMFPAKKQTQFFERPETPRYYDDNKTREIRPLAILRVFAQDVPKDCIFEEVIFPGEERLVKFTGRWWWEKTIVVSTSTDQERLQAAIINAVRFADRHFAYFRQQIALGKTAIEESSHLINAIKEVEKLTPGNTE